MAPLRDLLEWEREAARVQREIEAVALAFVIASVLWIPFLALAHAIVRCFWVRVRGRAAR